MFTNSTALTLDYRLSRLDKLKTQKTDSFLIPSNFRVAQNSCNLSSKSFDMERGQADFEIRFKCMSGFTTNNAKFIMPLQEKMSYRNSLDRCNSFGFTNHFMTLSDQRF